MKKLAIITLLFLGGCSGNPAVKTADCFETALPDVELMECVEAQRLDAEMALEHTFKDVLDDAPNKSTRQLEQAQASWINYAQRHCELKFYGENGVSRHIENNLCLKSLAVRREAFMREFYPQRSSAD
jgi:uncharacterized protein YecT (DUF1311 family)